MKVLQINCVFREGSTGHITGDLHDYYKSVGIDSHVIFGRGKQPSEPSVYKVAGEIPSKLRNLASRLTGNLYGTGRIGLLRTASLIRKIKPDVVHLHCINGYFIDVYGLLDYLKKNQIPTLLTLHAEFMHTGNCGYSFECDGWRSGCVHCPDVKGAIGSKNRRAPGKNWQRMKEALCGFDTLTAAGVSDWIAERARLSPIMEGKRITTVLNGLDDSVFYRREEPVAVIDAIHARTKRALLFVTPYFEDANKGGRWLLELAERMKDEPFEFVVVGSAGASYDLPNVHFVGRVSDPSELAKWYSAADLTLLFSKRETFSMICAETLSCGTPIVGFRAGAPEGIALCDYSEFVPYGDLDTLAEKIREWSCKELDRNGISAVAKGVYSKRVMAENYIKEYEKLLKDR